MTSASEIWALTVMVARLASSTIVGADCTAFTVCPSLAGVATTTPSIGAMI